MTCHDAARAYHDLGLHPIPCAPKSKRPIVKWQEFQTQAPTLAQIDQWWAQTPDANVALVLGRGIFAVDLDGGPAAEQLLTAQGITLPPDAPRSRTASGAHVFLSSWNPVPDRVGLLHANGGKPAVDIRGVGIVVAPPSVHPTGARYEWERPLTTARPPSAPDTLLGLIAQQTPAQAPTTGLVARELSGLGSWVTEALHGVGEGQRDATCTKLAGFFLGKGLDAELTIAVLTAGFGRACTPPFPERDVRKCVLSIARREAVAGTSDVAPVIQPIRVVLQEVMNTLERGAPPTVPTPFARLNELLNGGWSPGELVYLGARPGIGKTALGLTCARTAAITKKSVLVVSREMTNLALGRRLVAQDGRIPAGALKRAELNDTELRDLSDASVRLSNLPLWLTDQVLTLEQLNEVLSRARHLGLVIVDYLQLLRAPREIRERRHQVEHISAGLKTLALQYQVPVLCLSSLSRPQDKEKPRRPALADLRESGELEHDADVILLLHRPDMAVPLVECQVAKNREGELGTFLLDWEGRYLSFRQRDGER